MLFASIVYQESLVEADKNVSLYCILELDNVLEYACTTLQFTGLLLTGGRAVSYHFTFNCKLCVYYLCMWVLHHSTFFSGDNPDRSVIHVDVSV